MPEATKKVQLSKEYLNLLVQEQRKQPIKTRYERLCKFAEKLRIRPPKDLETKLQEDIIFSSMNITPTGVFSASILSILTLGVLSLVFSLFINDLTIISILFVIPLGAFFYIISYPKFRSQVLKVQTGDEAIKIILYIVIYLKLHPSFEGAINFAAEHTQGPISSDIKKAMWDVQVGKYKTIEEALAFYMPKWGIWNEDFVRSLSLLHGVLIEPSEEGREKILRKSLEFLLTNTHRKMRSYVEDISGSINILHIMGMLLPVIGLIMFPMMSMFLHQSVNPFYIAIGYTIILPIMILFFMNRILLKRPSAFIFPDISKHPELPPPGTFSVRLGKKHYYIPILPLVLIIGVMIMLYGILHFIELYTKLSLVSKAFQVDILKKEAEMSLTNLFATFSITGGLGIMIFLYFYLRSFQRIHIRNNIKNIENDLQVGLFALGNYLSEGYPIEKSIEKSLDECKKLGMQKRPTFHFFSRLLYNIKNFGMTFKSALFHEKTGVVRYFPSILINEIMRILSDASERSSTLLGKISKTIGSYLEDLSKIEAKIKELLEEVRAGIKIQSSFVIPLVCAMVGSLGIFLLNMLKLLSCQLAQIEKNLGLGILGETSMGVGSLLNDLVGDFTKVMPMTLLQAIVGIYTFEIVALFAMLLNGIENGFDDVSRDHLISSSVLKALVVYAAVTIFALILFQGIIVSIVETAGGGFACE
ncbi:MAG: hypothetical protein QMD36_01410 [Candidatus Aenigmarchaeota archaeon]|nr:hypothetical protein [Candidatus Aenigmarchaeota archaeon]